MVLSGDVAEAIDLRSEVLLGVLRPADSTDLLVLADEVRGDLATAAAAAAWACSASRRAFSRASFCDWVIRLILIFLIPLVILSMSSIVASSLDAADCGALSAAVSLLVSSMGDLRAGSPCAVVGRDLLTLIFPEGLRLWELLSAIERGLPEAGPADVDGRSGISSLMGKVRETLRCCVGATDDVVRRRVLFFGTRPTRGCGV